MLEYVRERLLSWRIHASGNALGCRGVNAGAGEPPSGRPLGTAPFIAARITIAGLFCLIGGAVRAELPSVDFDGDVVIARRTVWRELNYRIHGNLILDKGGVLVLEHSTVELMNGYSRQYRYLWRGGRLISRDSTFGGTMRADGTICQSNLELLDGEWDARDTTVRYVYGIVFGGERRCRLRATRLIAGPNPDSVIMGGRGDVELRDSTYAISLTSDASHGGRGVFDLPIDTPISTVYDARNVPGARYRLRLVNCRVRMWFLFVGGMTTDGPKAEIAVRCKRLIPSIMGWNLRGAVNLPTTIDRPVTIGNVTWKPLGGPVGAPGWGVYLTGDKTDLTLTGPTRIAELMLWGGKAALVGDEGTYNAATNATTIDVGQDGRPARAELRIRNATIGWFGGKSSGIRGQITACGNGAVTVEHARCDTLTLVTRDAGTISIRDIVRAGEFRLLRSGGPITVN